MISTKKVLYKVVQKIASMNGEIPLLAHPVGSYYETSDTSFDPNESWGGTWALDSQGRVSVAAGTESGVTYTVGDTGGSKDAVIVSHNHGGNTGNAGAHSFASSGLGARSGATTLMYASSGCSSWDAGQTRYTISNNDHTKTFNPTSDGINVPNHNHSISAQGESGTNKNMPPYIVVNRWHRTA